MNILIQHSVWYLHIYHRINHKVRPSITFLLWVLWEEWEVFCLKCVLVDTDTHHRIFANSLILVAAEITCTTVSNNGSSRCLYWESYVFNSIHKHHKKNRPLHNYNSCGHSFYFCTHKPCLRHLNQISYVSYNS